MTVEWRRIATVPEGTSDRRENAFFSALEVAKNIPNGCHQMRLLRDDQGLSIQLTEERLEHILEHPEMVGLDGAIADTLGAPELVIRAASDEEIRLHYRFCRDTCVGDKFLCVVVKARDEDAFVLTAYLTDKPKRGEVLWSRKP